MKKRADDEIKDEDLKALVEPSKDDSKDGKTDSESKSSLWDFFGGPSSSTSSSTTEATRVDDSATNQNPGTLVDPKVYNASETNPNSNLTYTDVFPEAEKEEARKREEEARKRDPLAGNASNSDHPTNLDGLFDKKSEDAQLGDIVEPPKPNGNQTREAKSNDDDKAAPSSTTASSIIIDHLKPNSTGVQHPKNTHEGKHHTQRDTQPSSASVYAPVISLLVICFIFASTQMSRSSL